MLFLRALSRSFDWSGTATRKEFALYTAVLLAALGAALYGELQLNDGPIRRWALPLATFAVLYPGWVAVSARRLHEMGRSAWWMVLGAVPYVSVALVVVLAALPPQRSRIGRFSGRIAYAIGAAFTLVLALVILSRILWQPFYMPSGSMKPTLLINDVITVAKPFRQTLTRGAVIAFRHPTNGQDFVKRLIGLPGDTVQMKGGQLVLNGAPVPTEPAGEFTETYEPQGPLAITPTCRNAPVGLGGTCRADRYSETLPGRPAHDILDIGALAYDDTPLFTVPEGQVFVMGDHRDNSMDSRMPVQTGGVGLVPANHIIGTVRRVLFSTSGRYWWEVWHLRPDRTFRAVE